MPPVDPTILPYRPCVGIMLLDEGGRVFTGRRIVQPKGEMEGALELWQMPQGGVDEGEDALVAARRELLEETGVESAQYLGETKDWLHYDLPSELVGIALKGRFRGQKQKWFAFRFTGAESEIRINPPPGGHPAEFDRYEWRTMDDVLDGIVAFKRPVYEAVIAEFRHWAPAT